jgi:hypothetical protein
MEAEVGRGAWRQGWHPSGLRWMVGAIGPVVSSLLLNFSCAQPITWSEPSYGLYHNINFRPKPAFVSLLKAPIFVRRNFLGFPLGGQNLLGAQ